MRVGFFTVFRRDPIHYVLADVLMQSVRKAMPGVEIVQFTDATSPAVYGVDAVRRKPNGRMLERRMEHYAETTVGDWLLLDTDVIVQRDVRQVFDQPFSVAFADRNWPHIDPTPALTAEMPVNTGIVFSHSSAFWEAVLSTWRAFTVEQQGEWYSEQKAVAAVLKTARFDVQLLPGMQFNYPPATEQDEGKDAAILHFKGNRKPWMVRRIAPSIGAYPIVVTP